VQHQEKVNVTPLAFIVSQAKIYFNHIVAVRLIINGLHLNSAHRPDEGWESRKARDIGCIR
jgi:hypothetical protein